MVNNYEELLKEEARRRQQEEGRVLGMAKAVLVMDMPLDQMM